ncbi:uncharacterized protein LOC143458417 [Clavelina lepadiformis]|uniref:Fe2OG dioxygenase domain-containing protein n=1 Tax=Clavelina lepadiformis TaxID=159417 RepID=A0ABP0FY89_CLALP
MGVPLVDLQFSDADSELELKEKLGRNLVEAVSTVGFVYVKNSGISSESVARVNEVTEDFFKRPSEKKRKYQRDPEQNFGYVGIEAERTDVHKPGDYKEAFDMSGDVGFSEAAHWPDDLVPGYSALVKDFMKQCKRLGLYLLELLSLGLQLEPEHNLLKCHRSILSEGNKTTLRSLYYPPLPRDMKLLDGQLRCGEHTDYGTITLLFQDKAGGLQVKNSDGDYVDALPLEDTVLINVGDMLEYQTCGQLRSTMHRVVIPISDVNLRSLRRSLVYFIYADHSTIINKPLVYKPGSPWDKVNHDPNAAPITALEHVYRKWGATY